MAFSFYHHPGERRGPVAGVLLESAALNFQNLCDWAPAFAGVALTSAGVAA